jgi:hypothetical protein
MLPYSQFEECIDLLTTPVEQLSQYDPNHTPLWGTTGQIAEFYIEGFSLELEQKILSKVNKEQKEDLIRHYISRLMKSTNHLNVKDAHPELETADPVKDKVENPIEKLRASGMYIMDIPKQPDSDRRFRQGCNIMYNLMFDEIQKCCSVYSIPFIDICAKLEFPLESINVHASFLGTATVSGLNADVSPGSSEKLKLALMENGFFTLSKVRDLKESSRDALVRLIFTNEVPYKIAMFDFLSFIDYFYNEYSSTRKEMYKRFGEIFCAGNKPVSERTIQGNINDLNKKSADRDPRYTASFHKEEVKKHYEALK